MRGDQPFFRVDLQLTTTTIQLLCGERYENLYHSIAMREEKWQNNLANNWFSND